MPGGGGGCVFEGDKHHNVCSDPLCQADPSWQCSAGASVPPPPSGFLFGLPCLSKWPVPSPSGPKPAASWIPACPTPSPPSDSSVNSNSVSSPPAPPPLHLHECPRGLSPSGAPLPAATAAHSRPLCRPAANMMCPCKKNAGFTISLLKTLHDRLNTNVLLCLTRPQTTSPCPLSAGSPLPGSRALDVWLPSPLDQLLDSVLLAPTL